MGKATLRGLLIDTVAKANATPRDLCEFSDADLEAIVRGGIEKWARLREVEELGNVPVAPNGSKKRH
jgi:hypothetical protein